MPERKFEVADVRVGAAAVVAVVGLIIPQALVVFLVNKQWAVTDIATIVGLFTGVVGTLVGSFLGVQAAAAGNAKAQDLANRAIGALPPERAAEVLGR